MTDPRPPSLITAEGDPVCFAMARYDVLDSARLALGLTSLREIDEYDPDSEKPGERTYSWFEVVDPSPAVSIGSHPQLADALRRRSLGYIRWVGDRLTLECMSEARLRRGKALLAKLGDSIRHRVDSLQTVEQALAQGSPDDSVGSEIPHEVQEEPAARYYEQHYADWPDTPLPALGGRTPRQALRTAAGRARVEELLRQFENRAERQRRDGEPAYDVASCEPPLGLDGDASASRHAFSDLPSASTNQRLTTVWPTSSMASSPVTTGTEALCGRRLVGPYPLRLWEPSRP